MGKKMDLCRSYLIKIFSLKVILLMEKYKETDALNIQMKYNFLENGRIIKGMVLES